MATYFVGDLQGCYDELQSLLEQVKFDPTLDRLYLTGDLVARGNKSLECLRFVKSLGKSARTVLGNHDLHLLSTALGIKSLNPKDNLNTLFCAPDFDELVTWLRYQPLLIYDKQANFVLTHAGISPEWDLNCAKQAAKDIENMLQMGDYRSMLEQMYDTKPDKWHNALTGIERLRYSINVFTRMRFCYANHRLDFDCKLPVKHAPETLKPWFAFNTPTLRTENFVFGHWASLVNTPTPNNIYALDTGCVWGNFMTLLRWEDKTRFTQKAFRRYCK